MDDDQDVISFNYFHKNFIDPSHPDPFSDNIGSRNDCELNHITVNEDEICELLDNLDPNKSAGDDGVHPKVLKECSKQLCTPLQIIFQLSLDSGIVPKSWKVATVTPVHKAGPKNLSENYRPISITSQMSKLLEKIVRKHLLGHLEDTNILSNHQHGFCNKRSCMSNLLETFEDITVLIDSGIPVDEMFMDFRKAFDKVSHERLLYKLDKMGVRGNILLWIESFLHERVQRVKVNGSLSSWGKVTSGVPQGSVLGPILFLAFINDLTSLLSTNCKLFADDAKLYSRVDTPSDIAKLQKDINACLEWANQWGMEFHPDKCKVIHFGHKNTQNTYNLGSDKLTSVKEAKDLGIKVSDDLKWTKHITMCVKKANRMIGLIKNTFTYMDKDMFLVLYKSLVRPLLEYCPQVWSPYMVKDITALEKVQRRATKIVPEISDLPYEDRLQHLGLFPLQQRRQRGDMITVFKILNGMVDIKQEKLCPYHPGNQHTRRHNHQIIGTISKTDMRKNSFSQRIVLPWNMLTEHIVTSTTIDSFKARYDKAYLGNYIN